jgi:hypothetical protein
MTPCESKQTSLWSFRARRFDQPTQVTRQRTTETTEIPVSDPSVGAVTRPLWELQGASAPNWYRAGDPLRWGAASGHTGGAKGLSEHGGKLTRAVCAVRRFEISLSQTGGTREKVSELSANLAGKPNRNKSMPRKRCVLESVVEHGMRTARPL